MGISVAGSAVPPFVEAWPIFLQYYVGVGNILPTVVLFAVFLGTKRKRTIHEIKEYSREVQGEEAPV